jgi:hypothetical protein
MENQRIYTIDSRIRKSDKVKDLKTQTDILKSVSYITSRFIETVKPDNILLYHIKDDVLPSIKRMKMNKLYLQNNLPSGYDLHFFYNKYRTHMYLTIITCNKDKMYEYVFSETKYEELEDNIQKISPI